MRKVISAVVLASMAMSANAMDPVVKGALIGIGGTILVQQIMKPSYPVPPPVVEIRQGPMMATAPGYVGGVPLPPQYASPDQRIIFCAQNRTAAGEDSSEAWAYCQQWEWNDRKDRNRRMREASERADQDYRSIRQSRY
jgi:hypothetical protein